jgi:DNA-binding transcriptional ArsR family regulator
MERAILELLAEHDWLGYEQIAEISGERPGEVRQAIERLRERGLVAVLPVGVLPSRR